MPRTLLDIGAQDAYSKVCAHQKAPFMKPEETSIYSKRTIWFKQQHRAINEQPKHPVLGVKWGEF